MPFDAQEYARALKQLPRERQRERLIQLRDKNPQAFTAVMSSMTAAEAPKPFGVPVEQGPDRRVVTQQFIESQLRGRVDNTTELPGGIQAQLSRVEELPRAIDTLGRSSELPRGTAPAGVTLPNGETRLYYRDEGTNQYHSVNRPGLSPGDVGATLGPMLTPGNAALIGTYPITGPLGGVMRGGSWLARLGRLGAIAAAEAGANAGARAVDEYLEGGQTGAQIAAKAAESAGVAVGARAVMGGAGVFANVVGRRTSSTRGPTYTRAREGVESADRLGYPIPTLGQLIRGRAGKNEAIAGVSNPDIRVRENAGLERGAADLAELANRPLPTIAPDRIAQVLQTQRDAVDTAGRDMLRRRSGGRMPQAAGISGYEAAGDTYRTAYRRYVTAQQEFQRQAVAREDAVRQGNLLVQPIDEFQAAAERVFGPINLARRMEVTPGTPAQKAVPGKPERPFSINPETGKVTPHRSATPGTPAVGARPGFAEQGTVELPQDLAPFNWLIREVQNLDPAQPAQYSEGLRRIETNLGAMLRPEAGFVSRRHAAIARELYGALLEGKRRVYSPLLTPGAEPPSDPDILKAAVEAQEQFREVAAGRQAQWKAFREVQDAHDFIDGMDSLGGGELAARSIISQPTTELTQFMLGIMTPVERDTFRGALFGQLVNEPDKIPGVLRGLGKSGVQLLGDDSVMVLEALARERGHIDRSTLSNFLENMDKQTEPVRALIETDDVAAIRRLMRDGDISAEDVQTVVISDLVDRSTILRDGKLRVNPQAYHTAIARLRKTNAWGLLPARTRELVTNLENYTSFVHGTADMQSGLAGGELVTAGTGIHGLDAARASFIKTRWAEAVASITTNESFTRYWLGGKDRISFPRLKQAGLGFAQWLARVNSGSYRAEQTSPPPVGATGAMTTNTQ